LQLFVRGLKFLVGRYELFLRRFILLDELLLVSPLLGRLFLMFDPPFTVR
jgi:hypothetical protein